MTSGAVQETALIWVIVWLSSLILLNPASATFTLKFSETNCIKGKKERRERAEERGGERYQVGTLQIAVDDCVGVEERHALRGIDGKLKSTGPWEILRLIVQELGEGGSKISVCGGERERERRGEEGIGGDRRG